MNLIQTDFLEAKAAWKKRKETGHLISHTYGDVIFYYWFSTVRHGSKQPEFMVEYVALIMAEAYDTCNLKSGYHRMMRSAMHS